MSVELHAPDSESVAEVARLLVEEGLDTRPPRPSLGQWVAEVGELLRGKMFSALGWVPGSVVVETVVLVVLGLGAALLLTLVVLALRRRRSAVPPGVDRVEELAADETAVRGRGAAYWRSRVESFLSIGDHGGALEALWSWLLSTVAGDATDVRPLAGRRLVREAGRLDLLPIVLRLEALSYGGARPEPALLRDLARSVEGAAEGHA